VDVAIAPDGKGGRHLRFEEEEKERALREHLGRKGTVRQEKKRPHEKRGDYLLLKPVVLGRGKSPGRETNPYSQAHLLSTEGSIDAEGRRGQL